MGAPDASQLQACDLSDRFLNALMVDNREQREHFLLNAESERTHNKQQLESIQAHNKYQLDSAQAHSKQQFAHAKAQREVEREHNKDQLDTILEHTESARKQDRKDHQLALEAQAKELQAQHEVEKAALESKIKELEASRRADLMKRDEHVRHEIVADRFRRHHHTLPEATEVHTEGQNRTSAKDATSSRGP